MREGNTAIGQSHQNDRSYSYTDKSKLNNFHRFLLLDNLEPVPDKTIPDSFFQSITV